MAALNSDKLEQFEEAVQSLKLYRRAELESPQGEDLIEKLYVDPLPHDHVHSLLRRDNTTFLIGRKGTGKSTVFLRAQKSLLSDRQIASTYVDIKTVYESAQTDRTLSNSATSVEGALPKASLDSLILSTAFIRAVVSGIRDDLKKQLASSWKLRVKETFTGTYEELSRSLDGFIDSLSQPNFTNIQGIRTTHNQGFDRNNTTTSVTSGLKINTVTGPSIDLGASVGADRVTQTEQSYSDVLLRSIDIRDLIKGLKDLLEQLNIKHLYVFLDDFSELPLEAMQTVVDVVVAPLNNWSDELVKFKIAAYPGRIYYGQIDKTKVDEVSLDLHNLYGQSSVSDMEDKGVEFTRRLIEKRMQYFDINFHDFVESKSVSQVWMALFQASLGNPRVLGNVLYFAYQSHLLYGRQITVGAVREAAKKYYEDKIESYFAMGKFLHESFEEKSTIYSLKELLEQIVDRARSLRAKASASIFRTIDGQHPTSHFNASPAFESLLSTLELNFFITRYYVMSNRDGHRVSVYALNYGLCEKYSITFGRPSGTREHRLYFVERVFDYNSLLQDYIASNQEIKCGECASLFEIDDLDSLKRFNMLCPNCRSGQCTVTNISRKYEGVIRQVNENELLPSTELGILQTLSSDSTSLLAGDIAGELDVSYQLIGKRAKRLDEMRLLHREMVHGRREYQLSDVAKRIYFKSEEESRLDVEG